MNKTNPTKTTKKSRD